jgi:hypothetical protein
VNSDAEELRQLIEAEVSKHKWAEKEIQEILLQVARNYVWRQGLWTRVKFAVNVIGILGVIGGAALAVISVLGLEIVHK